MPSPLRKSQSIAHLPLFLLAVGFMFPLVWLVCSSLQPREQVGQVPPEWIPARYQLTLTAEQATAQRPVGSSIFVTPPQPVDGDSVLVVPEEGPEKGHELLIRAERYVDGKATLTHQEADQLVTGAYPARLQQRVPRHFVRVSEWHASASTAEPARHYYVEPSSVRRVVAPVLANYPEAIRALTAREQDKNRPLGELLERTRFVWTPEHAEGRTVTFLTYLINTLMVAVLGVLGTTLSSAVVAYGLSRISWRGREGLFAITLATMMVPFPVLMIPLYSVFRTLGWIGSLKPLWVPYFFGSAFNIFLLRQFFLTIPKELSEAARIDGCSELQIFARVILPLAKPAISVVALFHFLFVYNDFLGPYIFLTEPRTFTMALGLQQYQSQLGGSEWHLLMAASVILVLPVVILFFFTQKTFIQGISTTGMKG